MNEFELIDAIRTQLEDAISNSEDDPEMSLTYLSDLESDLKKWKKMLLSKRDKKI